MPDPSTFRFVSEVKPGLALLAVPEEGVALEVARRRDEGSVDGGVPRRDCVDADGALRGVAPGDGARAVPAVGGFPRCWRARSDDAAGGAGAAGDETAIAVAAGFDGVAACPFGSPLRLSPRLAREVGAFGRAAGSTGLVTLSVIRAMGTEKMPVTVVARIIAVCGVAAPGSQPRAEDRPPPGSVAWCGPLCRQSSSARSLRSLSSSLSGMMCVASRSSPCLRRHVRIDGDTGRSRVLADANQGVTRRESAPSSRRPTAAAPRRLRQGCSPRARACPGAARRSALPPFPWSPAGKW